MRISENEFARMPSHLRQLFCKLPNHGSDEVLAGFPDSARQLGLVEGQTSKRNIYAQNNAPRPRAESRGDSDSSARFFYSAKASAKDRMFSVHPTIKPIALMRWLVRMVTPPGGTTLDPFAGTGTTAHAALLEGFKAILCEREAEYRADIERRMSLVFAGDVERASHRESESHEGLPLFGGEKADAK